MGSANEYGLRTVLKAGSNGSYDDLLSLASMQSLEGRHCIYIYTVFFITSLQIY